MGNPRSHMLFLTSLHFLTSLEIFHFPPNLTPMWHFSTPATYCPAPCACYLPCRYGKVGQASSGRRRKTHYLTNEGKGRFPPIFQSPRNRERETCSSLTFNQSAMESRFVSCALRILTFNTRANTI
jgi:hypothetical protein